MNNILITSAGRRVSLVRFFQSELKKGFPEAKVIAADAMPDLSSACHVADGFFKIPRISSPDYLPELLRLSIAHQVKLIIPTIDTELLILAQNIGLFRENGIEIVVSDYETVKIFRHKRATHDFFAAHGINFAKEFDKSDYKLPLYIKPFDGSRSVDNFIITEASQLTDYHFSNEKLMFLEYLDHKKFTEYTIDLYYDKSSRLKCFIPRKRIEVRDGEVNKAITKRGKFVEELWQKMEFIEGFRGCITFQVFVHSETEAIYGIEINPRFGGGYPLSYLAGGNFPKWIIEEYLMGNESIPVFNQWEENLMMLRYDDEVLVHNFKE
ncbi:carbamoyl phosphate synthase large subunit [Flavobacterium noncentrifugens]|uniref:Carbamoyl-phosphate synthase large subunit n=1 Tax=Flavobacterium noncentrifugens TaxID=1128970 RepID=A0A1G8V8T8_9FLAO|nr:ATP-grasp domain-containing protein [Flavobacterium noncentrifugens]GEP50385.1 carbamoyl phosphate synthase large subunit [Flavobacterium noncentrifugens]SDJ62267.1 carbamoyl-phosphate synthase large subunit [Flavobacterium noncentrifugens]